MPTIFYIHFAFCGVTGLILWFIMLDTMEKNGIKVSYSWVHPGQYIDFYKFIKKEKNLQKKFKYKLVFWLQIMIIPSYLLGSVLIVALTNH